MYLQFSTCDPFSAMSPCPYACISLEKGKYDPGFKRIIIVSVTRFSLFSVKAKYSYAAETEKLYIAKH